MKTEQPRAIHSDKRTPKQSTYLVFSSARANQILQAWAQRIGAPLHRVKRDPIEQDRVAKSSTYRWEWEGYSVKVFSLHPMAADRAYRLAFTPGDLISVRRRPEGGWIYLYGKLPASFGLIECRAVKVTCDAGGNLKAETEIADFACSEGIAFESDGDGSRLVKIVHPEVYLEAETEDARLFAEQVETMRRMITVLFSTARYSGHAGKQTWPVFRDSLCLGMGLTQTAQRNRIGIRFCLGVIVRLCQQAQAHGLQRQILEGDGSARRARDVMARFATRLDPVFSELREPEYALRILGGVFLDKEPLARVCRENRIHRRQGQRILDRLNEALPELEQVAS